MPEPVANNAVTQAYVNGDPYVYSFSGIDTTRIFSGIHLKAFRYDVINDQWDTLPPLPDEMGKIAAGASTVKNKIYIIGGYNVFSNGNEKSSVKTHVFDPETNQYLPDGAPIPVPIDDQVQAVWRDSLIYVVTGWSNTTNVSDVQIYNPSTDTWTVGTPLPNSPSNRVFGGSGTIIGDTIYYVGGARVGGNFPLTNTVRKGIIQPNQPDSITWTFTTIGNSAIGYRMGSFAFEDQPYWLGGSAVSYNYNGIAYNGSGAVSPLKRIMRLSLGPDTLEILPDTLFPTMDLRGVAQVGDNQFMIVGGMRKGPVVTDKTLLITAVDTTSNTSLEPTIEQPFSIRLENKILHVSNSKPNLYRLKIVDMSGRTWENRWERKHSQISVVNFPFGVYAIQVQGTDGFATFKVLIP